jgi:hypothetical protein
MRLTEPIAVDLYPVQGCTKELQWEKFSTFDQMVSWNMAGLDLFFGVWGFSKVRKMQSSNIKIQ